MTTQKTELNSETTQRQTLQFLDGGKREKERREGRKEGIGKEVRKEERRIKEREDGRKSQRAEK